MTLVLLAARLLLALVLAVAGVAKLADRRGTRVSVAEFGVPVRLSRPAAWGLPLVELACAAALVPRASAWWGAAGALVLLAAFTGAIVVSLARGRSPDCHCFGPLHPSRTGWRTLVRNGALAALAAFIVWQGPGGAGPGVMEAAADALGRLDGADVPVAGLAAAFLLLAAFELWALVHVLRQNGRLMLRLEAIEGRLGAAAEGAPLQASAGEGAAGGAAAPEPSAGTEAPADAGASEPAVKKGDPVPALPLPDLSGRLLDLAAVRGRRTLLLFWHPACGFCQAMLDDLKAWERARSAEAPELLVISGGTPEANRRLGFRSRVLLDPDFSAGDLFGAGGTPSAVLLDEDGRVASAVGVGASAVLALAGAARAAELAAV